MASLTHMLKKASVNTGTKGVVGVASEAAVGFAASYGIARVYHQYGDKWYGKHAARLAAGVGLGGAVAMSMYTGGPTFVSGVLHSVGQAGVNALGLDMGLRHARAKTGKRAVLVPTGSALPPGASEMSAIGALGRAGAGTGLSWEQISELAHSR
jgi:hypothetical protein